ncbi:Mom family adenine methylcarbamoylation protein [Kitasatospora purpeofusca]|uniref:Mom family adenine methylcarbamoylation protein n=1 Tax=Kitasatospora purpeofusca TaxID=67352 RepID=UPI0035DBB573
MGSRMLKPVQDTLPFDDLAEIPNASDWCQRWQGRRHSFRHVSEGGFDARRYVVEVLPEKAAKEFVVEHHYSGSFPSARFRFGLYDIGDDEARLCGVAVFGVPVTAAVLTRPLPDLQPYVESVECSRFVLTDACPANSESWFLARCFDELLVHGVRGVVSFADPVPRRDASGTLVAVGHVGTIYQATNAVYMGRATPRTMKLLPNGAVLNARMLQKVRRQEQGHEYAERLLTRLGAPAPRAGADPKEWLREALVAVGARNQRHRGVHRYVYRLGRNRRERENIRLGLPTSGTFPKTPDGR